MKKTRSPKEAEARKDDLEPEYRFDYSKAQPNRATERWLGGGPRGPVEARRPRRRLGRVGPADDGRR